MSELFFFISDELSYDVLSDSIICYSYITKVKNDSTVLYNTVLSLSNSSEVQYNTFTGISSSDILTYNTFKSVYKDEVLCYYVSGQSLEIIPSKYWNLLAKNREWEIVKTREWIVDIKNDVIGLPDKNLVWNVQTKNRTWSI